MTDEEKLAEDWITKKKLNNQHFVDVVNWDGEEPTERFYNELKLKQAFLAGLKAGKPKWHKVADGDLPEKVDDYVTNIGVLTYDNYGNGVHKWHTPYCEACDYADEVGDDEVIAWCEIPIFIFH